MDPDPDAELMLRLKGGEDGALNALMARWQQPLVAFIYRYVKDHTDALDLAQEAFVRVYETRSRYTARAKFSAWLFTIAANLCKNYVRWRERHPEAPLDAPGEGEETLGADEATPAASLERAEAARLVQEAVAKLPHDLKTVVLLFEYHDFSYEDIAATLGCTAKAVETRLYRARKLLRKHLAALEADKGPR
jgi:RNA polymerase sigma-70 factor (ECF subfamily)